MKKILIVIPAVMAILILAFTFGRGKAYAYPDMQWKECRPRYQNDQTARSAKAYNRVIDQFHVTGRKRYQKTESATFCNIFSWDVMSAMKTDLPHWVKDGRPADSNTEGAREMNVNATCDWLDAYGEAYGWRQVTGQEAQDRANAGYPTFGIWKNPESGRSGHIMVVRPENSKYRFSEEMGPVIAQAGLENYSYENVRTAMQDKIPVYYTND